MPSSPAGRVALALFLVTLGLLGTLLPYRVSPSHVWGDEGTFLAMTESLVGERDLTFDGHDRERLLARSGGASTVILGRSDRRIAYSKPILFPLLAAPFYALFGPRGIVLLNVLALAGALALARAFLRRLGPSGPAALTLATFAGAAVVIPYVFWRMSDALQLALATAGLTLTLARWRGRAPAEPNLADRCLEHPAAPAVGAFFLGLLVSLRLNNALVAAVPIAVALVDGRPAARHGPGRGRGSRLHRVAVLAIGTGLAVALILGLTYLGTGISNPYRAVRTSFSAATGYPGGPDQAEVEKRFVAARATHQTALEPSADLRSTTYAGLYFWVGRHTGFLIYFPAALALLMTAMRRLDRVGVLALGGFATAVAFLVGWYPWNYFGGDTFIGNRYILPAYPLLLVALKELPRKRLLAVAWALAFALYGSAWISVTRTAEVDRTSQSHAHAGLFRWLPYESTTPEIAGRRDRYWADHLVRFVDPYASIAAWTFELAAGDPATELQVAQWQEPRPLRLAVQADRPGLRLVLR